MFFNRFYVLFAIVASAFGHVKGQAERHRRGLMYRRRVAEHADVLVEKDMAEDEVRERSLILLLACPSAPIAFSIRCLTIIISCPTILPLWPCNQISVFWKRVLMPMSLASVEGMSLPSLEGMSLPSVVGVGGGKAGKKSKGAVASTKSGKASSMTKLSSTAKAKGGTSPPKVGSISNSGSGKSARSSKGNGSSGPPTVSSGGVTPPDSDSPPESIGLGSSSELGEGGSSSSKGSSKAGSSTASSGNGKAGKASGKAGKASSSKAPSAGIGGNGKAGSASKAPSSSSKGKSASGKGGVGRKRRY